MIKLKNLLSEITLGSVTPYATQFVWQDKYRDGDMWEADIAADSQPIKLVMQRWKTPMPNFEYEYQFAFFTRGRDNSGWSTSASNTAATGGLNVLALLKTVALAIRDFADQNANADVIDVTGADSDYDKGEQKSRIYQALFAENGMTSGFSMKSYGGKLYLIKTGINGRTADATGVSND